MCFHRNTKSSSRKQQRKFRDFLPLRRMLRASNDAMSNARALIFNFVYTKLVYMAQKLALRYRALQSLIIIT